MIPQPSLRIDPGNPDHHLWNNNGTWWLHYSVVTDPRLKARRVRTSLGTKCRLIARERRDACLAHLLLHAAFAGDASRRARAREVAA